MAVTALGRDPKVRVVVLRAEGKGFNAGVDIKEMQKTTGFDALIGANKGCFAAFAAVYDCPVPVISAVAGFCVGGGIGLVGTVIRAAKESLNGIDLWDVKRSYRYEQGFTFELNLTGVSDELRDDFAGTDKSKQSD